MSVWAAYERAADGLMAKASAAQFYIDTYERSDTRSAEGRKIRPESELLAAKEKVKKAKIRIREILQEIEGLHAEVRWNSGDDSASVDVEEVGCSKCKGFESEDTNDVVLCDRKGCFRAFHVLCCDPVLTEDQLGDPDDDWFCHQCNCQQRIIDKINETFDKNYEDPDRWTSVFESDTEESTTENHLPGTILANDLDTDDDEDSDFHSLTKNDREQDDDESRDSSDSSSEESSEEDDTSQASGDDPLALEQDRLEQTTKKVVVEDVNEKNIIDEPRKKSKINYVALNDSLFNQERLSGDEDEDDDDDESWT